MQTVMNYLKLKAELKSIESNWRYECFFRAPFLRDLAWLFKFASLVKGTNTYQ